MRWLALATGLCIAAGGCLHPGTTVRYERDDFARIERWRTGGDGLRGPAGSVDQASLAIEAVRPHGDSVRYALLVEYRSGKEPLGLRRGESLVLLADTARYVFSTDRVETRRGRVGTRESARFSVPGEAMRQVALAREVRVRLLGRRWYVDRAVSSRSRQRIRRLVEGVEGPLLPRPGSVKTQPGAPVFSDSVRFQGKPN